MGRKRPVPDAPAVRAAPPRKPLTARHREYLSLLADRPLVFAVGPPGTGKTALAVRAAARRLRDGAAHRLVLTRPLVECDEEMGFLPGSADEKLAPFVSPLLAFLEAEFPPAELAALRAAGRLLTVPLGVMRGRTFGHGDVVVADEMQNATARQIRMLLTRLGDGGRCVLTGDVTQTDLRGRSPLVAAVAKLSRPPAHPEVGFVEFDRSDVLRGGLAAWCDERLA